MAIRILSIHGRKDLAALFNGLKVDPYGTRIMVPKAISHCLRIDSVSCIAATILKQEMLSLGADAALPRDVLTGRPPKTDCILIGNLSQFSRLVEKLQKQPFGLAKLACEIRSTIANFEKRDFTIAMCQYRINLGTWPHIMGIMNLTPDSFSGDGLCPRASDPGFIVEYAKKLVRDGADIIDIGGESTRPGARPVGIKDELRRVIPAIRAIARNVSVPVSIDTYKPQIARAALDNGACMVNDISGLRNPAMITTVKAAKAGIAIMHMQNNPQTMQVSPVYGCVTAEVIAYLKSRVIKALDAGIRCDRIIVDPGIGFGKTVAHNLALLRNLGELRVLGVPILVGTSRKGFIGRLSHAAVEERLAGTIASCVLAVRHGAHIVRVHDVKQIKQALQITRAILHD